MKQDTAEWHEFRHKHIGASDCPVILGISPWKTRYQLWEEKTAATPPLPYSNPAMEKGKALEPKARAMYELKTDRNMTPKVIEYGRIPYLSASLDGNTEIFRLPYGQNTKPQRLTRNWAIDVSPSWSPDGKKMVFVSDRAVRPDLYVMDLKRGKISRLTFEGSYNADPAWSPRGDQIAYVSRVNKHFQIFRIRPDGSEATQLTTGAGDHLTPTWSPDGRLIAFSSNQQGSYDIYLIRSAGGGMKRITWDYHDETDPAWSPSPIQ